MKWLGPLIALLLAFSGTVEAQDSNSVLKTALAQLPTCAIDCLVGSVTKSTCELNDLFCISRNAPLITEIESCVQANCTVRQALTTKNFTATAFGHEVRDHTKLVSYSGVIGGGIALLAVILRVIARLPCCGGTWGGDDWWILITMMPVIPLSVMSVVLAENGLGRDIWTVPFPQITMILKIYYYDEMLYLSSIALTKISILMFYLRIFPDPTFRKLVWVGVAYCVGYIISTVLALVFQCQPLSLAWNHWDGEHAGTCINLNLLGWLAAALNMLGDLIVILLPLQELKKLALGRRKKAGITLMFLGGSFVTVVSMLRLKYMIQFANSHNITWDYTPIGYWSTLEVHVGVVIACLPAIRSLQRRVLPSSGTSTGYPNVSAKTGYYCKGGSPFPSAIKSRGGGGHVDLARAASEAKAGNTRFREKSRDNIQLDECEFHLVEKKATHESDVLYIQRSGSSATQNERLSILSDDDVELLPIQGMHAMPPPSASFQRDRRDLDSPLPHYPAREMMPTLPHAVFHSPRHNTPSPLPRVAPYATRHPTPPEVIRVQSDISVTVEQDPWAGSPDSISMRGRLRDTNMF